MLRNIITRKWFVTPLDVIKYISLCTSIDQLGLTVRQPSLHFLTDYSNNGFKVCIPTPFPALPNNSSMS